MRFAVLFHIVPCFSIVTCNLACGADNAAPVGDKLSQHSVGSKWQVGYAQADITPPIGHAMMAGFGMERYADGALAPLRAQAIVLQDESGRRALLYTADVLGFSVETVDLIRHKLQQKHGLTPESVCLAASHTHWGPAINYHVSFAIGGLNVWYVGFLEKTLLRLADEAIADLSPATVSYADGDAQIGMCRRVLKENGECAWGVNPAGSYDRHTPIVKIVRKKSPKQLVIVGHACHPTSSGGLAKWWPDYPGVMRECLETRFEDCRAMFVMGCGGDAKVVHKNEQTGRYEFSASVDRCKEAGTKLADAVTERLNKGDLVSLAGSLETKSVRGKLSFAEPMSRDQIRDAAINDRTSTSRGFSWWARQSLAYPDSRRQLDYEVQTWRIGPLRLVALEGEVCADWGDITRAMSPARPVMVVAYANSCPGYIPTARIIREGGYEGNTSHQAYFLPAPFAPKMEAELTQLIRRAFESTGAEPAAPGTKP